MNENGGIYGGCFDCEDCKEQNLYCEDCSMYKYDKYRLSNQEKFMGKSLEFVKERIASGQCNGMENNRYKSMIEQDIRELFTIITCTKDGTILIDVPYLKGDKPYFNVIIKRDPDADFEYFTMQRCNCDGTFVFFQDLMGECIDKMIHLKTCNVNKEIPKDLTGYSIIYTVGDFVLAEEFGDEFATKEKPWMKSRFTAMLPIKFDVVRNGE